MKRWLRQNWHTLVVKLFRTHIQEEITNCVHPEMGWLWRPKEQGGKALIEQYRQGYHQALIDTTKGGKKK